MNNPLIGRGWAFPVRVDGQGRIALTCDDDQEIVEAIRIILSTTPGERVMRPTFGSHLFELAFAPLNHETGALARRYVEDALRMWEPRIRIIDVEVDVERDNQLNNGCLNIILHYEIKSTHDRRSLVYPFYLIPEE
jgi:hypothetical protein